VPGVQPARDQHLPDEDHEVAQPHLSRRARAADLAGMRGRWRFLGVAIATVVVLVAPWWFGLGRPPSYGVPAHVAETPDSAAAARPYRLARLTVTTTTGRTVECVLRTPVGVPGRLPAILLSGGIRTGRRAALLVDSAWAGVVLSCDYPWPDPTRRAVRDLLLRLPRTRAEVLATPQAMQVAARVLVSRPEVDSQRVAAVGASLGVPVVAAWAAADQTPRAVALVHGGGDLRLLLARGLEAHVASGVLRAILAASGAALLGPLDPVRTAGRIAPRPLLIVAATDDQRIPAASVDALVSAARPPVTVRRIPGRHLHPSDADLLRALTDTTMAWLRTALP
jgi:hypothetical protein